MIKRLILLASLSFACSANAAVITSHQNLGNPLVTGAVQFYNLLVEADTSFAHSLYFTTDSSATLGAMSAIDLDLAGVSSFLGPLTISLYEDKYTTGESTSLGSLVFSAVGSEALQFALLANTSYSLVIEGLTGSTPNNAVSGAVAISGVPLPPAAWLLGSALVGLATIRGKAGTATT